MPATIGAAPLVPFHRTSDPPGETPRSCSLGAATPMVIPWVEASWLAWPDGVTPATVKTPGIVAGAPTRVVPLPRLPAATTTTTSCENAYWKAVSHDGSQSSVLVVNDRLITFAPLSTAHFMAEATWVTNGTFTSLPNEMDADSSCACGATPIMAVPTDSGRAAAREATQLP